MLTRASQSVPIRTLVRFGSSKNVHIQNPSATEIPAEGKSAGKQPVSVKLEAQKLYAFCNCGHSDNQPFCDGSHKGAGKTLRRPIRFTVDKTDNYWLCMCKHSKKVPLCDGTHKTVHGAHDKPTTFIAFGNSPVYDGVARKLGYKYRNGGFQ